MLEHMRDMVKLEKTGSKNVFRAFFNGGVSPSVFKQFVSVIRPFVFYQRIVYLHGFERRADKREIV